MQPVKPNSHVSQSATSAPAKPSTSEAKVGQIDGATNRIETIAKQVGSTPLTAALSSPSNLPSVPPQFLSAASRAGKIVEHMKAPAAQLATSANSSDLSSVPPLVLSAASRAGKIVEHMKAPAAQLATPANSSDLEATWAAVNDAPLAKSKIQSALQSAWAQAGSSSSASAAESATQSVGGLGEIAKLWDGPTISLGDLERGDILLEIFDGDEAHLNIMNMHIWLNEIEEGTNGINPNLGDPKITHNAIVTGNGPDGPTVGHAQGNPAKKVIDGPWTPKPGAKYYVFNCQDKNLTDWAATIMQCWASEGKIDYNYEDRSRLTGEAKITPGMAPFFEDLKAQAFDSSPKLFGPDASAGLKRGGLTCGEAVVAALAAAAMNIAEAENANVEGFDPKTALKGAMAAFPRHLMPQSVHDLLIKDPQFKCKGIMTPESMAKPAETQASKPSTEAKKKPNE